MRDGAGAAAGLPRPSILLFWAIWCTPCRAETREFAALKAAAGPMPILIVPLDSSRQTRRELAGIDAASLRYASGDAIALMQRWTDGAVGLPANVAIGPDGRRCAIKFGAVGPEDVRTWRQRCG